VNPPFILKNEKGMIPGMGDYLRYICYYIFALHVPIVNMSAHKFYKKILGFIPYYVGLDQKIINQNSRIYFIEEDTQIDDKLILVEGFTEVYPKSEANNL
jgi:hypothetical protein